MRLYCVRHGQSTGNVKSLYFQPPDEPLSEAGIHQARVVARRLKDIQIDEIITSDYTRAEQTGDIIKEELNVPISNTSLLRERRGNSKLAGKSWDDPEVNLHLEKLRKSKKLDFKDHDEESVAELLDRAEKFLENVGRRTSKNIAVVSHGIFINTLALLITLGRKNITTTIRHHFFEHTWVSNTGITVFEEWEPGEWYLLTWNDHAHLS